MNKFFYNFPREPPGWYFLNSSFVILRFSAIYIPIRSSVIINKTDEADGAILMLSDSTIFLSPNVKLIFVYSLINAFGLFVILICNILKFNLIYLDILSNSSVFPEFEI